MLSSPHWHLYFEFWSLNSSIRLFKVVLGQYFLVSMWLLDFTNSIYTALVVFTTACDLSVLLRKLWTCSSNESRILLERPSENISMSTVSFVVYIQLPFDPSWAPRYRGFRHCQVKSRNRRCSFTRAQCSPSGTATFSLREIMYRALFICRLTNSKRRVHWRKLVLRRLIWSFLYLSTFNNTVLSLAVCCALHGPSSRWQSHSKLWSRRS